MKKSLPKTSKSQLLLSYTRSHFEFSFASIDGVLKEIKKLNPRKAAQSTDVPVKILKDNADIFADYICGFFNQSLNCCKFQFILKRYTCR